MANPNPAEYYGKEMEEEIIKADTKEELEKAVGQPLMEIHSPQERAWKNAFVVSTEYKDTEVEWQKEPIPARWGTKVLSKEKQDGRIEFVLYHGDVDKNDDWWNKHSVRRIKDSSKEDFEKFLNVLREFAKAADLTFNVQDYSIFQTFEAQTAYGQKIGGMTVHKMSDKASEKFAKLKGEEKDAGERKDAGQG